MVPLPETVRAVVSLGQTMFAIAGDPRTASQDPARGPDTRVYAWGSNYWGALGDLSVPPLTVSAQGFHYRA